MNSNEKSHVGWFEALGDDIPQEQRDAAIEEAREMGLATPDDAEWVNKTAEFVELDHPEEAMNTVQNHLDLTGTIRFLAVLCQPVECTESNTTEQSDTDVCRVYSILSNTFDSAVFTVENRVVWVSGINSNCSSIARNMAIELSRGHNIPTSQPYEDNADRFGGMQFNWGDSA